MLRRTLPDADALLMRVRTTRVILATAHRDPTHKRSRNLARCASAATCCTTGLSTCGAVG